MKITNCTECGKVCLKSPSGLCPICQQAVHEAEEKVAEYLFDYPHSTIEQVHSSTKIARHIIMHMIRTGRIVEGAINYHCEICNALITSGRICKECTDLLECIEPKNEITLKKQANGEKIYYEHYK